MICITLPLHHGPNNRLVASDVLTELILSYDMFCVEILEEKLVKNVFFRVFETKKPLEKFCENVFLDT